MELPVIGEQHFGLSITSDREAQLTLQGAIDLDEPIYYNVGSDGKLEFTLSETTNRILGRLGTTLLHAGARPASRLAHPNRRIKRLRASALPLPCLPPPPPPPASPPARVVTRPPANPRRVLQVERLRGDHGRASARLAGRAGDAHARVRRGGRAALGRNLVPLQ